MTEQEPVYTQTAGQFSATAQLVLGGILQQLHSLDAGFAALDNHPPSGGAKSGITALLAWVVSNYVDPPVSPAPPAPSDPDAD